MEDGRLAKVHHPTRRQFSKSALWCAAGTLLETCPAFAAASETAAEEVGIESATPGSPTEPALRKVGGFRCLNLTSLRNDSFYNLFTIGYWSRSSFSMDIWKRHGVPYWYPKGAGNLRVMGREWRPPSMASPVSTKSVEVEGTYSKTLIELDGKSRRPTIRFTASVPRSGDYLVRVACNSGKVIRSFELLVDGLKAELESYPYLDASLPLTRRDYSSYKLGWYPGWRVHLSAERHDFVLSWPKDQAPASLIVDAVCLQFTRA